MDFRIRLEDQELQTVEDTGQKQKPSLQAGGSRVSFQNSGGEGPLKLGAFFGKSPGKFF